MANAPRKKMKGAAVRASRAAGSSPIETSASSEFVGKDPNVLRIARRARLVVKVSGCALGFFFAWLKLHNVPVGPTLTGFDSVVLVRASLVVYYFSWWAGALWDISDQELLYLRAPNRGRLPAQGLGMMVLLAFIFGLLCYVNSPKWFAVFLATFLALNVAGWRYLVNVVLQKPYVSSDAEYLANKNHVKRCQIKLIWQYLNGNWQWYRFAAAAVAVCLLLVLVFSNLPRFIAEQLGYGRSDSIVALSVFTYVIGLEVSVWYMRLRTRFAVGMLADLNAEYSLDVREVLNDAKAG